MDHEDLDYDVLPVSLTRPGTPLPHGEFDSFHLFVGLAVFMIVALLLAFIFRVYQEELPGILENDSDEEIRLQMCGDAKFITVSSFEDSSFVRLNCNCQLRPMPPLLAEPSLINTYKRFPKGLCYNKGEASEVLRQLVDAAMHSREAIERINVSVARTAKFVRKNSVKTGAKFSLKDIECWVLETTLEVLFERMFVSCKLGFIQTALNDLYAAKEEIGQMVYRFDLVRFFRRGVRAKILLSKYNSAIEEIHHFIKAHGIKRFLELAEAEELNLVFTFFDVKNSHAEVYEMVTELLMLSMKKLGHSIFQAFTYLASCKRLQSKLISCLDAAVKEGQDIGLSEQEKMAPLVALVRETLRVSAIPRYCHLRTNRYSIHLGYYEVPSDTVLLPTRIMSKEVESRWKSWDTFFPDAWYKNCDMETDLDENVANNFHAFGAGERRCVAEEFALTVMRAFITHFTVGKKATATVVSSDERSGNSGSSSPATGSLIIENSSGIDCESGSNSVSGAVVGAVSAGGSDATSNAGLESDAGIVDDSDVASNSDMDIVASSKNDGCYIIDSRSGVASGSFTVHRAFCPSAGCWIGGLRAEGAGNDSDGGDEDNGRVFIERAPSNDSEEGSSKDGANFIVIYDRKNK